MGFLDDAKNLASKAQDLAEDHQDQVKAGLDKAEGAIDGATGHKYTDQISGAADKVEDFLDKD